MIATATQCLSLSKTSCGTGGMLLGAIEHVQRAGGDPRTFLGKIFGQEKNLTASAIARMNLVLHGIEDFQIVREDMSCLRERSFLTLMTILTNNENRRAGWAGHMKKRST